MAVIGITLDKYNEFENSAETDDDVLVHINVSHNLNEGPKVEPLDSIVALPLVNDNPGVYETTEPKDLNEISIQLFVIYNFIHSEQEETDEWNEEDTRSKINEEVSKLWCLKKDLSYGLLGLEADHPGIDQSTLSDSIHFMLTFKIIIEIWNVRYKVYRW